MRRFLTGTFVSIEVGSISRSRQWESDMASTYTIERSATIAAAPKAIFEKVSVFRTWPEWSPWQDLDPDMQTTYVGEDGQVGSGYSWTGNRKAGAGSMKMTSVDAPSRMGADLVFDKPFKSSNTMSFELAPDGDATAVTWTMIAPHNVMTRVMSALGMMERMVGKDFEKGLAKLKTICESATP